MKEFFKSDYDFIIGCDPGPAHSAFALVYCDGMDPDVVDMAYVPNGRIAEVRDPSEFYKLLDECSDSNKYFTESVTAKASTCAFVFEKCGVQAGGANALVFETCMTAGAIRQLMGHLANDSFAFSPSDWRYVLTGKGSANDTIVRNVLLTLTPNCDILSRRFSTKAKKELNLKKPITSHVRDAAGVALALGLLTYRTGNDIKRFPARTEVHCG